MDILCTLGDGSLTSWQVAERILGAARATSEMDRIPVQRALQRLKGRGLVVLEDRIRWSLTPLARLCPACGAQPRECCIGEGKTVVRRTGPSASYAVHPERAVTQAQVAR